MLQHRITVNLIISPSCDMMTVTHTHTHTYISAVCSRKRMNYRSAYNNTVTNLAESSVPDLCVQIVDMFS